MSSPTPLHGSSRALAGREDGKRRVLRAETSGGVLAGIRAWRRKAKSTSSSASSGRGLGMGMAGTPAKSVKPESTIGWRSTPPSRIPSHNRVSSDDEEQPMPSLDLHADTIDISVTSLHFSGIDHISPVPNRSARCEQDSFEDAGETHELFPELEDFLVPLNDLSDDTHRGQCDEGEVEDEDSVELGRAANTAEEADYAPCSPFFGENDMVNSASVYSPQPKIEAAPVQVLAGIATSSSVSSYWRSKPDSPIGMPWLMSAPQRLDSPTSSFVSPMRYSPPTFTASPSPVSPRTFVTAARPPALNISPQVTIKPRKRKRFPVWRGARIFDKMKRGIEHGVEHASDNDSDEFGTVSAVSGLGQSPRAPRKSRRASSTVEKTEDDPEAALAYEIARKRRIAHYIDLELNYRLTEEWVLW